MAEVTQGDWLSVSGNPNFWTRIRVWYSGSSAQGYLQIRRDSGSYTGYYSNGQINCGGSHFSTKYGVNIASMTIDTTWRDYIYLGAFTINPATSTLVNAWANCTSTDPNHARFRYNANNYFGGVTIPAQVTSPSGVSASVGTRTWNSAQVTAKVTNWGGQAKRLLVGLFNTSATTWSGGRREEETAPTTGTTSWTKAVSSSSRCGSDGGTQVCKTIRGCISFKVGAIAINDAGSPASINSTTYYLPPSPMTALSVTSQTGSTTANSVTVNFSTTGGNSTNNESVNVTTQFRYSTNNGSTWSAWANVGTAATPWTARTGSFTVPYGTATKLQTRQVYQSQASEVKELSFTSTASTAPSGGTVSKTASTSNSVTVSGSVTSFGAPSSVSTRSLTVGISSANGSTSSVRTASATATSSTSAKLTSSSSGTLSIAANTAYTPYLVANNSLKSATFWGTANSAVTCPPDLSTFTTSIIKPRSVAIKYTYTKAGSALPEKLVYTIDGKSTEITAATSGTILIEHLEPNTTYTVSAKLKTTAGQSDNAKSVTFTTEKALAGVKTKVDGSWKDNNNVYVKVNGSWKNVTNVYVKNNGEWKNGTN